MATFEVSKTLVKSPPELWSELAGDCLSQAVGEVTVRATEPERALAWEAKGARGTALLEPSGWGTKVTLTAEVEEEVAAVEEQVAYLGFWSRFRPVEAPPPPPEPPRHAEIERKLEELLDDLGAAHRRPFVRE